MLEVLEKSGSILNVRVFGLSLDGQPLATMSMERQGAKIVLYEPDSDLSDDLKEILVRAVINAASRTGLLLITSCEEYTKYGFSGADGIFTAKSGDIIFPRLCQQGENV